MTTIVFGTDGWRDRIADGFTVARVRRVARAYGQHLLASGAGLVLVAHDTRFGGAMFQAAVAATLRDLGLPVAVHDGPLPTPVLSFAVRELGAVGGVMLTASHNPAADHGVKLKEAYGGTASTATYADVARRTAALPDEHQAPPVPGEAERFDVREAYYRHLGGILDLDVLLGWRGRLVHDAMHGAAAGWIAGFAQWASLPWHVDTLRAVPDATFGGASPEPIPATLGLLSAELAGGDPVAALGVASDGDGDRLAVVPVGAAPWSAHAVLALLLDHLDRRGTPGRVVKTVTVSRLVERLAHSRGRAVVETPVGFKYLVEELLEGDVMVAGEESGGFSVAGHIPERDSILSALLVVEALALGEAPLPERLSELEREAGWRHAYDRVDLTLAGPAELRRVFERLAADPERFSGRRVHSVERRDGVKLNVGDDRWVMLRASGTEPLLRVYAEGPDDPAVAELLAAARAFAEDEAQPSSR
jgi:phosphomannomutase